MSNIVRYHEIDFDLTLSAEEKSLIDRGEKIKAIKSLRERTKVSHHDSEIDETYLHVGLMEAKLAVEAYRDSRVMALTDHRRDELLRIQGQIQMLGVALSALDNEHSHEEVSNGHTLLASAHNSIMEYGTKLHVILLRDARKKSEKQ